MGQATWRGSLSVHFCTVGTVFPTSQRQGRWCLHGLAPSCGPKYTHTALGLQASFRDNRAVAEETACSLVLASRALQLSSHACVSALETQQCTHWWFPRGPSPPCPPPPALRLKEAPCPGVGCPAPHGIQGAGGTKGPGSDPGCHLELCPRL